MNQDFQTTNGDLSNFPEQKTEFLAEELQNNDLQTLKQKHGQGQLFEMFFKLDNNSFSVADIIRMRIHGFASNFYPKEPLSFPYKQEVALVELVSVENENSLVQKMKQINPKLVMPANYLPSEYQTRAKKLSLAHSALENILLDNLALGYLPDTINFLKLSDKKFQEIADKINDVSQELTTRLKQYTDYSQIKIDDKLVNKCIELFKEIGRIPLFIQEENFKQNTEELIAFIRKLEIAFSFAEKIKALGRAGEMQTDDNVLEEIKKIILPTISI